MQILCNHHRISTVYNFSVHNTTAMYLHYQLRILIIILMIYRIQQNFRGGKLSAVVHKTHYSLENFCGASGPRHYVLYTASDSRGKLPRLAKNREKPQKFCRTRYRDMKFYASPIPSVYILMN